MTKEELLINLKKTLASKNKINIFDLDCLMESLGAFSYFVVNSDPVTMFYDNIPSWYFPKLDVWIQIQKTNLNKKTVIILDIRILEDE